MRNVGSQLEPAYHDGQEIDQARALNIIYPLPRLGMALNLSLMTAYTSITVFPTLRFLVIAKAWNHEIDQDCSFRYYRYIENRARPWDISRLDYKTGDGCVPSSPTLTEACALCQTRKFQAAVI